MTGDGPCQLRRLNTDRRTATLWRLMAVPEFHMVGAAPQPVAPFSHAAEVDGWLLLTGQMPTWPDDPDRPLPEGIEAQTRRVMDNLVIVLGGVGLGLEHVAQARVYLTQFDARLRRHERCVPRLLRARAPAGADLRRCHGSRRRRARRDRCDGEAALTPEPATVALGAGEYTVNEPGTWHTADVGDAATALFITAGVGTRHRPR